MQQAGVTQDRTGDRAPSAALWDLLGGDGELVVLADARGVILFVSPDCARMGYRPEDLTGRLASDLVHPDDLARFALNTASLYVEGLSVDPDLRAHRFRRSDGAWVWLLGGPTVVPTHDGRRGEIANVFKPLPEREAQERLVCALTGQGPAPSKV